MAIIWEAYPIVIKQTPPADIWGKIRSRKSAALAGFLQTAEARKAVQTRLVGQVAQGYYKLLMLDAQIVTARKNLQLSDSTLRIIQLQSVAQRLNEPL
nr:TolC family protein [uncultured Dyadobacter sp.]